MHILENILKAVSDKNRLRILMLLSIRKMCVCELAYILGITQPSVSKHIKKLSLAGLIGSEQYCFWTNYYLKKDSIYARILLPCFKKWLKKEKVIKEDLKRLKKTDRKRLKVCYKKMKPPGLKSGVPRGGILERPLSILAGRGGPCATRKDFTR